MQKAAFLLCEHLIFYNCQFEKDVPKAYRSENWFHILFVFAKAHTYETIGIFFKLRRVQKIEENAAGFKHQKITRETI